LGLAVLLCFLRGFSEKSCFCGGEFVVSAWWSVVFLWWGDWGLCGVEKHANFLNFILGRFGFGNGVTEVPGGLGFFGMRLGGGWL
jgi:hypothetical protein